MTDTITVVMPIYEGLTQLDFTGPHQFLSRTPGVDVIVASIRGRDVHADGLTFGGLTILETVASCDVLLVPGGAGCVDAIEDDEYLGQVGRLARDAKYLTSACSGSLILGAAGLLKGRRAACHGAWRDLLPLFGAVADPARIVRAGNILTGGGVTAGIASRSR